MAEINIERKKKPTWPWILLLIIVIALVAWALYALTNDRSDTQVRDTPATGMVVPLDTEHALATATTA